MGEGKTYSLEALTKATNLVLGGAKLIGTNSDVTGPIEKGIAPACRALIDCPSDGSWRVSSLSELVELFFQDGDQDCWKALMKKTSPVKRHWSCMNI